MIMTMRQMAFFGMLLMLVSCSSNKKDEGPAGAE